MRSLRERVSIHHLVIWSSLVLWFHFFSPVLLPTLYARADDFVGSQAFWFYSEPPPEADNITVVAIDEESRRRLDLKWPWKRDVTADLISKIAALSPRVIGLDIVFAGRSDPAADAALVSALNSHPRVVLGFQLHRDGPELPFRDFAEAATVGFVNKPMEGGIVKRTRLFAPRAGGGSFFSLDVESYFLYRDLDREKVSVGARGISYGGALIVPASRGSLPLNFLVHPARFRTVPAWMVLEGLAHPGSFEGRIVLVGATDPLVHDEFYTPAGLFPGVTIVGNSLAMLLSGRFLESASLIQNLLFVLLPGLCILFLSWQMKPLLSFLSGLFVLAGSFWFLVYLRGGDIHFAAMPVLFSGATALLVPNLYRYLNLMFMSNRLKKMVSTDPLTGLFSARYFLLLLEERMRAGEEISFIALRISNYRRLTLSHDFSKLKDLYRRFGADLKSRFERRFAESAVARISNDTFAALVSETSLNEAADFAREFLHDIAGQRFMIDGSEASLAMRGCLVHHNGGSSADGGGAIRQAEGLLESSREGSLAVEELRPAAAREREHEHGGILDFVAYDWKERDKDLEKGLQEVIEANRRLERLNWGALSALARAVDAKSPWTAGHSERVTKVALKIGTAMGLDHDELDELHRAALLHDIGKIGTPLDIIDKPDELSDDEYRIMCEHPETGERILEPIEAYRKARRIAMEHHEWFNGEGYPLGIAGEEISLGGRILALADVYDALVSARPYREMMTGDEVRQIIVGKSGTHFDPAVVEVFLRMLDSGEISH